MNNDELKELIVQKLKEIYDPEIPVNIWELGLIYEINIHSESEVGIVMTLTSPNCPVAESLPVDVENKIKEIGGLDIVIVKITFFPTWGKEMMSEAALLELGFL